MARAASCSCASGPCKPPLQNTIIILSRFGAQNESHHIYRRAQQNPRRQALRCGSRYGREYAGAGRVRNLMARAFDDVLNQREPAGDRQQENLFDDAGAPLDAIVNLVRLDLFCGDNRADVLNKIDATFLAGAAFALFVLASRAFVTQRSVATRAESRDVASIRATLKTFDRALRSRAWGCGRFNSARRGCPACLHGRVARFTGRESSTHMHILALQPRLECSAEQKRGFAVNTGRAYSPRDSEFSLDCICNRRKRRNPAAARANAFAATACLREIDRFSGRKGT